MNLTEIANKINKDNLQKCVITKTLLKELDLLSEFSLELPCSLRGKDGDFKLKTHTLISWVTSSGVHAEKVIYFFDNKPVAYSEIKDRGDYTREGDERFQWFSEEDYDAVRQYIYDYCGNSYIHNQYEIADLAENLKVTSKIFNVDNIPVSLWNKALLNGVCVEIVSVDSCLENRVFIQYLNSTELVSVKAEELEFSFQF